MTQITNKTIQLREDGGVNSEAMRHRWGTMEGDVKFVCHGRSRLVLFWVGQTCDRDLTSSSSVFDTMSLLPNRTYSLISFTTKLISIWYDGLFFFLHPSSLSSRRVNSTRLRISFTIPHPHLYLIRWDLLLSSPLLSSGRLSYLSYRDPPRIICDGSSLPGQRQVLTKFIGIWCDESVIFQSCSSVFDTMSLLPNRTYSHIITSTTKTISIWYDGFFFFLRPSSLSSSRVNSTRLPISFTTPHPHLYLIRWDLLLSSSELPSRRVNKSQAVTSICVDSRILIIHWWRFLGGEGLPPHFSWLLQSSWSFSPPSLPLSFHRDWVFVFLVFVCIYLAGANLRLGLGRGSACSCCQWLPVC